MLASWIFDNVDNPSSKVPLCNKIQSTNEALSNDILLQSSSLEDGLFNISLLNLGIFRRFGSGVGVGVGVGLGEKNDYYYTLEV